MYPCSHSSHSTLIFPVPARSFSSTAYGFGFHLQEKNDEIIPDEVIMATKMFDDNWQWAKAAVEEGVKVIDNGSNGAGTRSTFYEME